MMRNPYDRDTDNERGRYSRGGIRGGGERRDFDYNRDYEQDRWRGGGQGYRGPDYDETDYGRDQDRWHRGYQSYGGMYNRDYEQDRWRGGGQGYRGRSYDMAAGYTEDWQVPGPFTGRGPRGYQRSDDRIKEDVCDRLTQHGQIDASDIDVRVENGEVTLTGIVDSRGAKRMAEDVSDSVQGVHEVYNQLRVKQEQRRPQGQPGMQNWAEAQNRQSVQSQQSAEQRAVGGTEGRS